MRGTMPANTITQISRMSCSAITPAPAPPSADRARTVSRAPGLVAKVLVDRQVLLAHDRHRTCADDAGEDPRRRDI